MLACWQLLPCFWPLVHTAAGVLCGWLGCLLLGPVPVWYLDLELWTDAWLVGVCNTQNLGRGQLDLRHTW